jgi:hypothetical protein
MSELTHLVILDKFDQFRKFGIFPQVYQVMNTFLSTAIPYRPYNFLIFVSITLLIYILNPFHLAMETIPQCAGSQVVNLHFVLL